MSRTTIRLEGLSFRAFHGVYPEEQVNGNEFLVDVTIICNPLPGEVSDDIQDTLDYAVVYRIVSEEMSVRRNLLEMLARRIAERILHHGMQAEETHVTVAKLRPPLDGPCTRTSVTVTLKKQ